MRHLSPEELVDLAEGTRARWTAPHLDACDECSGQLAELRAVMSAALGVAVPEPSPLFWSHFSRRVREAIALEGRPRRATWIGAWPWPGLALVGAVAALILTVALTMRGGARDAGGSSAAISTIATIATGARASEADTLADDSSLGLVAEMTTGMDWETAQNAGLAADGSAEHAVTHLSAAELRELDRLLKEALANPGA